VKQVQARDGHRCVSCAAPATGARGRDWSVQHRVARGAGGTSRAELNLAGNLALLCGSGVTRCHGRVERRGAADRHAGYWLHRDTAGRPTDPTRIPIRHALHGWVLLDNQGGWTATDPPAPEEEPCA
jgi:hypothetical protein